MTSRETELTNEEWREPTSPLGGRAQRLRAFESRGREYLALGYDRVAAARFVVGIARDLRGPALDVGTGRGLFAIELARLGLGVISVDIDDQDRDLARWIAEDEGFGDRISLVQADATRLCAADRRFGCVGMMDVLHHLVDPAPALHEMARVLERGGSVLIADFDEEGFDLVSRVHRQGGREHPRTSATVPLARKELAGAGLVCTMATNGHMHDVIVMRKLAG